MLCGLRTVIGYSNGCFPTSGRLSGHSDAVAMLKRTFKRSLFLFYPSGYLLAYSKPTGSYPMRKPMTENRLHIFAADSVMGLPSLKFS